MNIYDIEQVLENLDQSEFVRIYNSIADYPIEVNTPQNVAKHCDKTEDFLDRFGAYQFSDLYFVYCNGIFNSFDSIPKQYIELLANWLNCSKDSHGNKALEELFSEQECYPLSFSLKQWEQIGIAVNQCFLTSFNEQTQNELDEILKTIWAIAGKK